MNYFGASILVVGFLAVFQSLGATAKARSIFAVTLVAFATLNSKELDDAEKERLLQQQSIKLLRLFFTMVLLTSVSIAVPVAVIYMLDLAGLVSLEGSLEASFSIPFLIIASILVTLAIAAYRYLRKPGKNTNTG